jgi:hypothetical protein
MSGNGSRLVTLVDENGPNRRVEVRDRLGWQLVTTLSGDLTTSGRTALSGNGTTLTSNQPDTILTRTYVRNLTTGRTFLVDVPPAGGRPNAPSGNATISADRHTVAFDSPASTLTPEHNLTEDVFTATR